MSADFYEGLSSKITNANSALQSADRFNVRFLGIPENLSDFLSRQVKSITPRTITFSTINHKSRQTMFRDIGKMEVEPLVVIFNNDDEGIFDSIMMAQVMRQKGQEISGFPTIDGKTGNAKFDVKLEYINLSDEVTRFELYRKCWIQTLTPSDMLVDDNAPSTTTVIMNFDSVDYSFETSKFAFSL